MTSGVDGRSPARGRLWRFAWLALAAAYAFAVGWAAYNRVMSVTYQARAQLIVQYRLWELHPEYKGTPQFWTRLASRLLTDRQLMTRVYAKHAELAPQIELDYRNHLTIAQAEVVVVALALWAAPLAALYAGGLAVVRLRRRHAIPKKPEPASHSDSRYRM
ncbi:MAG: hypothetical protein AABZ67_17230 [Pseudomonadota bacterium]